MGRKKKTSLQILKASALAYQLAVLAGVKPTGHHLARWYERRMALPYGSESESTWRRFLEGTMPQKHRITILVKLEPELLDLFNHPLWVALNEESNLLDIFAILKTQVYPSKSYKISSLEDATSAMPALDRISLFILMILSSAKHEYIISPATAWLADSYAQLKLEPGWVDLSGPLMYLILVRFESVPLFSNSRFFSCNTDSNHKFWSDIYDDYRKNQPISNSTAWATWCSSISRLDWLERKRYLEYVNGVNSCSPEENNKRRTVYKKVRDQRYKLVRKTPKISIQLLSG
ncbi:hypothetical protein PS662_03315 [Pseudomonas fluorescens]|uniref:Uncharacterized protein n=1 Tax=Pseudomonas fluorescens TaxID=294 RepID=A0A5E6U3M7_PSEFL|nr:hypothetical protein [Pseudomonas fluorescens]VVN00375.1 hypothetical protein PS662_03315 [Pseudomonas fluorescens]